MYISSQEQGSVLFLFKLSIRAKLNNRNNGMNDGIICFSTEELVATIMQLFLAGYDTTTTTLTWCLLYLINYPSAQQRIYEEINQVIGEL